MSLTVTANPDGSVTVACGSDSVIVKPKQASAPTPGPGGSGRPPPSQWPVVTPINGGFNANIWADAHHAPVLDHALGDLDALTSLLRARAPEDGPALFRVTWTSKAPVPVSEISETLRTIDNTDRLRCDIHFSPDDE